MEKLHRWGPTFVLLNSLGIVAFALGGLLQPEQFWEMLHITPIHGVFTQVMAWYLLIFGVGGLLVWRQPARHPIVVALIGLEKVAPAILFPLLTLQQDAHWFVAATGVFDGIMAILLIGYGIWLYKRFNRN